MPATCLPSGESAAWETKGERKKAAAVGRCCSSTTGASASWRARRTVERQLPSPTAKAAANRQRASRICADAGIGRILQDRAESLDGGEARERLAHGLAGSA